MRATELELDALNEIANVGMSRAATQLSVLLDDDIAVSVPDVYLGPISELLQTLNLDNNDSVATVTQSLQGLIDGSAVLLFHNEDSRALINALIGSVPTLSDLDMRAYEHEAMTEIGNIIISSAVAVMADMMGSQIRLSVPVFNEEKIKGILDRHTANNDQSIDDGLHVIIMKSVLKASRREVEGTLMFMLDVNSIKDLLQHINHFLTSHNMT